MSCSVDSLKFTASWKGQIRAAKLQVQVFCMFMFFSFTEASMKFYESQLKCPFICSIEIIAYPVPKRDGLPNYPRHSLIFYGNQKLITFFTTSGRQTCRSPEEIILIAECGGHKNVTRMHSCSIKPNSVPLRCFPLRVVLW